VGQASVVLVATDWPDDLARTIRALAAHAPAATHVIIVANDPSATQAVALAELGLRDAAGPGPVVEVVWTAVRLGWAAALNAGIRRAAAPVVILMDTSVEPVGDLVTELATALEDTTVAATGPFGLVSTDMRRFENAPDGPGDVDAIEGYALAFRRADYMALGPLDEHFAFYRNLDIWWSLVLRDQAEHGAEEDGEDAPPRRAVRTATTSVTRHVHRGWTSLPDEERDRASKKNFYRVLKRFATRRDLLVTGMGPTPGAE
jgi:cysteinyl-tRNA synthetase